MSLRDLEHYEVVVKITCKDFKGFIGSVDSPWQILGHFEGA